MLLKKEVFWIKRCLVNSSSNWMQQITVFCFFENTLSKWLYGLYYVFVYRCYYVLLMTPATVALHIKSKYCSIVSTTLLTFACNTTWKGEAYLLLSLLPNSLDYFLISNTPKTCLLSRGIWRKKGRCLDCKWIIS